MWGVSQVISWVGMGSPGVVQGVKHVHEETVHIARANVGETRVHINKQQYN